MTLEDFEKRNFKEGDLVRLKVDEEILNGFIQKDVWCMDGDCGVHIEIIVHSLEPTTGLFVGFARYFSLKNIIGIHLQKTFDKDALVISHNYMENLLD